MRIEVGYGLEGALTDALSRTIIAAAVAPRFKQGDFAGGIGAGVDAMLSILAGDAEEWQRRADTPSVEKYRFDFFTAFIVLVILAIIVANLMRSSAGPGRAHRRRGGGWVVVPGSGWGGGFGGGSGGSFGGGGGGLSGGGGSSGGGGASGSW